MNSDNEDGSSHKSTRKRKERKKKKIVFNFDEKTIAFILGIRFNPLYDYKQNSVLQVWSERGEGEAMIKKRSSFVSFEWSCFFVKMKQKCIQIGNALRTVIKLITLGGLEENA